MASFNIYREVKSWKKPLHASRSSLARLYLKVLPKTEIIGITGSVGKTITQNAIDKVLSQKFRVVVGDENLDPTFRIPQTILKTKPYDKYLILEYGVEHPFDMDHYLKIVVPKIGVVTQIAETHLKYFTSIDGVLREKSKLIKSLPKNGYAILNADDPNCQKLADLTDAKIWWFGQKAKDGIKISHFSQDLSGSKFRMHYMGQKASVSWKIIGKHQLLSAYAAATVGIVCGLTLKQIAKGLSQVKPPKHRLNSIIGKDFNILDDTYNSSPKAAIESISTLVNLGKGKQKIAVFGEMKDLGKFTWKAHFVLGEKIARTRINYLITVGETAKIITQAAKKSSFNGTIINVTTTGEAIGEIKKLVLPKSLILIKGSRHAHLERIIQGLQNKSTKINCYHCGKLT